MDDSAHEPFEPGEGPHGADDRLRDSVSAARTSIAEAFREAVERLEHAEQVALGAAEERLGSLAAERVDDAMVRLGVEQGQLRAELERRMERAIERLAAEIGTRFGAAQARLDEVAARSAGGGADARGERERLQVAVDRALRSIREAESRALSFSGASEALETTERQAEVAMGRIEEALSRVERSIAEVGEAESPGLGGVVLGVVFGPWLAIGGILLSVFGGWIWLSTAMTEADPGAREHRRRLNARAFRSRA